MIRSPLRVVPRVIVPLAAAEEISSGGSHTKEARSVCFFIALGVLEGSEHSCI